MQPMVRIRAVKHLPYNSIRKPGDEFDAKAGYAHYFVKAKLAEYVDEQEAPKPKRKYTKRALNSDDYSTAEMSA